MHPLDRLYIERACELAQRAAGSTSPNPPVGAVVVRDATIAGEGYHHRAGEPHAEANALQAAGELARGATLYVSLEPCNHQGRTPPCTHAIVRSGVARVVAGVADPDPRTNGSGVRYLRGRGVAVDVCDDAGAIALIEPFARAVRAMRPYVSLKMAMSLDGYVAARPNGREWLTGSQAFDLVRDMRIAHDAVVVGAGTVRVDNPQLTVRPPHHRLREYVRVVACENDAVDPGSAIFMPREGYAKTIVLAPGGARARFSALESVAEIVLIGTRDCMQLDLSAALQALRERGISSVLCEGGPTMAAHLFEEGLVDRFHWLIAPRLLRSQTSVPVLSSGSLSGLRGLRFDRVEQLGEDVLVSGIVDADV